MIAIKNTSTYKLPLYTSKPFPKRETGKGCFYLFRTYAFAHCARENLSRLSCIKEGGAGSKLAPWANEKVLVLTKRKRDEAI